jgi:hypothetical protein
MNMTMNRISARQRGMMEVELRRAAGYRAVAAMAILGLVTMLGIEVAPSGTNAGALGLHTESYSFEVPASVEQEFRREAIAMSPATGVYEEPELTVNYELNG